ncbi:hypothetical protein BpHYR1_001532 [Brachionus plicatilis]|uniref:Uncharacterized protein n=1 Tax=Brachionus plicatilis TaxID=10195 RepID=A0A3M7QE28_BRAPC|nr:hypothetical protein BpHYR1_001532 [Brachionus plicatilis]
MLSSIVLDTLFMVLFDSTPVSPLVIAVFSLYVETQLKNTVDAFISNLPFVWEQIINHGKDFVFYYNMDGITLFKKTWARYRTSRHCTSLSEMTISHRLLSLNPAKLPNVFLFLFLTIVMLRVSFSSVTVEWFLIDLRLLICLTDVRSKERSLWHFSMTFLYTFQYTEKLDYSVLDNLIDDFSITYTIELKDTFPCLNPEISFLSI